MSTRRWAVVALPLVVAGWLAAAPPADSLPRSYFYERGTLHFYNMECGAVERETVKMGPKADRVSVETPKVGRPLENSDYQTIGTITDVQIARREVTFVATGGGDSCDEYDWADPLANDIHYRIRYRDLDEFTRCGKVKMFWTRAPVVAKGYVPCRTARGVATAWRKKQDRKCHRGFCPVVNIRGYRCEFETGNLQAEVFCERDKKRRLYWYWGD